MPGERPIMETTSQTTTMRDLIKSTLTLPWAISMFGVQQLTNLVAPPPAGRIAGTTSALDNVSDATARQLDGWLSPASRW